MDGCVLFKVRIAQHPQEQAFGDERRGVEWCYFHGVRFYAAVLGMLFALSASAQFTETLEVRVLELEATVVDREQNPVLGLTSDDFLVTIDGKPASITNFSVISRGATRDVGSAAGQNAVEMPVPTRLIIVIDDMHLHQQSKQRALDALRKYVEETMDPATTVTLVTWNGATLLTRTTPTTRRDILMSAINASAREMPKGLAADTERRQLQSVRQSSGPSIAYRRMVEYYAESRSEDAIRTIDALEDLVDTTARAIEGRKIILLVSEGIPLHPGAEMFASAANQRQPPIATARFNQGMRFEAFARRASAAGVVFSTLDPSSTAGMHEGGMDNVDLSLDTRLMRNNNHHGAVLLARETGGTVVADHNDLDRALIQLDERLSTYYSLAVRPPEKLSERPEIVVTIRDQPKLRAHVATRRGMPSRDEAIATAVVTQLTRRVEDNPLDAKFFIEPEQHERGCIAALQFMVPAEKLTLLPKTEQIRGQFDVWFALVDERNLETPVRVRGVAVTSKHGAMIPLSQPITLAAGQYVVSAAVVDRLSGAASYLQREVDCGR